MTNFHLLEQVDGGRKLQLIRLINKVKQTMYEDAFVV